ncbi:MAG: cell division protein FtsA [Paludibacter sp.]|nr:cell division protein FtsA [Paludibacter sp.]
MTSDKYVAIDLGSSCISAMAAEIQENGALKILAVESKPTTPEEITHGIITQVSGTAFKISEIIKLIQNSARISEIDQISISIGARSLKNIGVSVSRFVTTNKIVTSSLIDEMILECEKKVQGSNVAIYDIIPLNYELDGHTTNEPINQTATQITGHYNVIYGSEVIALGIDKCFDRTLGIVLDHAPLSIEALSAAVLDESDREDGCALIDFGAATTTLGIYKHGVLQQLSVIPLGGKNITQDIQELGISLTHAEKFKHLKGCAMENKIENPVYIQIPSIEAEKPPVKISTKFLATIIEARIEEILQPVFEAINTYPESLEAGIVITGGASKLNNLIDYIFEKTGMYTRFGSHEEWLSEKSNPELADPAYSQLIGTIALTHEYRQLHPKVANPETTETDGGKAKEKEKKKKRNLKDTIASKLMIFFGDENTMN